MKKVIDARKLDCPKPILKTKKALEEGGFSELEIIVDNMAACENVSGFLEKFKFPADKVEEINGEYKIYVKLSESKEGTVKDAVDQDTGGGKTVFIASDAVGTGSDELGRKLMKAFTFALTELDNKPERLLFMNAGVKLCLKGADSLPNILKLSELGVDILVCGTCLDFFGLTEQLAVGRISNMYDIAGHLLDDENVIKV